MQTDIQLRWIRAELALHSHINWRITSGNKNKYQRQLNWEYYFISIFWQHSFFCLFVCSISTIVLRAVFADGRAGKRLPGKKKQENWRLYFWFVMFLFVYTIFLLSVLSLFGIYNTHCSLHSIVYVDGSSFRIRCQFQHIYACLFEEKLNKILCLIKSLMKFRLNSKKLKYTTTNVRKFGFELWKQLSFIKSSKSLVLENLVSVV